MAGSTLSAPQPSPGRVSRERLLFGGVYGTVLASALAAALENDSGSPNAGYDALWILVSAVAAAAAHGYAHAVAQWSGGKYQGRRVMLLTLRSVVEEWPLVAAVLPTVVALLGAYAHWWGEDHAINIALGVNTVALFGWGLWAARVAGQGWGTACRVGCTDVLLGLFIIAANILSH
ncbi:hypothetical protein [Actinacidiphila yeochonensis]|uniref:hypothetical protein n=1 Tax=Actinacidiphila yeochonensis TaxID=89050 RepID=UPI000A964E3E|nr:hypothetical protein [Actinacidiphila yeochonensis]